VGYNVAAYCASRSCQGFDQNMKNSGMIGDLIVGCKVEVDILVKKLWEVPESVHK